MRTPFLWALTIAISAHLLLIWFWPPAAERYGGIRNDESTVMELISNAESDQEEAQTQAVKTRGASIPQNVRTKHENGLASELSNQQNSDREAKDAPQSARETKGLLSPGVLTQQIAEVSAGINKARDANLAAHRIVYIAEVKKNREIASAYEQAWRDKVERIGNMNYPEEARREKLTGSLQMAVGINKDGSVYSTRILQSSGHEVLDNAARRIIELSAPFAHIPAELQQEADVWVITRTWRFTDYQFESTGK